LVFNLNASGALPSALQQKDYVFLPISKFRVENKGTDSINQIAALLEEKHLVLAIAGAPSNFKVSFNNILNLGFISSPGQMAAIYKNAKCTLILSKVESFSMPVAESLCCGTPVAGFKAGGPESIAPGSQTFFADPDDFDSLIQGIGSLIQAGHFQMDTSSFDPDCIAQTYIDLYRSLS
jgi:putative colanic acid biosynthesis glycosyltransferase